MFSAIGISAQRSRTGGVTVKVRILHDRTTQPIETKEFSAPTLPEVQALIKADLQRRVEAATDLTLQAAVVGQVLAQV